VLFVAGFQLNVEVVWCPGDREGRYGHFSSAEPVVKVTWCLWNGP
jgi:hypothetical protein